MTDLKNTERFSNRVDNYVKYRPGYSAELLDYVYSETGVSQDSVIADFGSGTGIFTKMLLDKGSRVYAVEPNEKMRLAAQNSLSNYDGFYSVDGAAENSGILESSIDFVTCAQSFHWFDRDASKKEFRRILKPEGKVLLIWYRMFTEGSGFMKGYEEIHYSFPGRGAVTDHRNIGNEEMKDFFRDSIFNTKSFSFGHKLDFEGLKGRALSSSHAPSPGDENFASTMEKLSKLYLKHQVNNEVEFLYRTDLYWGKV